MADDNNVKIQIQLDDGTVKQGFLKIEEEGKSSFQRIAEYAAGVFGGQILTSAFNTIKNEAKDLFKDAVSQAANADAGVQRLNNSLAVAGRYSAQASQQFQNFADEIQRTTRIDDDTVLSVEALATTYTKTNKAALDLTKASINLSAVTGKDVNESAQTLAATLSGTGARLARLFPDLKQFSEASLKAGAAIDYFNARFSGAAEQAANTFSGRIDQLTHGFDDVLKAAGRYVTQSPAIVAAIKFITGEFEKLTNYLNQNRTTDFFRPIILGAITVAQGLSTFVVRPLEVVYNTAKIVFDLVLTSVKTVGLVFVAIGETAVNFFNLISSGFSAVAKLITGQIGFKQFASDVHDAINSVDFSVTVEQFKQVKDAAVDTGGAIKDIFNQNFSNSFSDELGKLETAVNRAGALSEGTVKNTVSNIKGSLVDLSKIFQEGIVKTVTTGITNIGSQLAKGKFSFKDFESSLLGVLGDILIQMGTTFITVGLGIEALKLSIATISAGPAIAAGIALLALGGFLKGLSGGGTQGATSGGVASSGSGGYVATDSGSTSGTQSSDLAQTTPGITVNIQGDVLDSRETGLRIIDLINDQFNQSGARVLAT